MVVKPAVQSISSESQKSQMNGVAIFVFLVLMALSAAIASAMGLSGVHWGGFSVKHSRSTSSASTYCWHSRSRSSGRRPSSSVWGGSWGSKGPGRSGSFPSSTPRPRG